MSEAATTQPAETFEELLGTPTLKEPVRPSEAHQGIFESVTKVVSKKGTVGIQFNLRSSNTGIGEKLKLWVPPEFAADVNVDPSTLPEIEEVKDSTGAVLTPKCKRQTQYALGIANTAKTAQVQQYMKIAAKQGRTLSSMGLGRATDIDSYIDNLNMMLSGISIVFTRDPQGGDDIRFANRLQASNVYDPSIAYNQKALKGYRKEWENGEVPF